MLPEYLKEAQIGILGFGINHKALVKWLVANGAVDIVIYDESEIVAQNIKEQNLPVKVVTGKDAFQNLDAEILFRSPGINPDRQELVKARESGVKITSQVNLFFELCPAKIIGITGSKGKGTTSTLIAKILEQGLPNSKIFLAGNIEKDPFEFIDEIKPNDIVVLELSSFQLVDLDYSPDIAVVLGITSDHLEYHHTQSAYVEAKSSIVKYQRRTDQVILNLQNNNSLSFAELTDAKIYYYALDLPVDEGVSIENDVFVLHSLNKSDEIIAKINCVCLRGRHNLGNVAAAIMAVKLCGVDNDSITKVISSFKGLPHRIQLVHQFKKVAWYDDSIATNPEATMAAIDSFLEPIILIAGGSDKGLDYFELGKKIANSNVKQLILIGQTASKIALASEQNDYPSNQIIIADTLPVAMQAINEFLEDGDVVLLSPASASFDQFPNYKVRGDQFTQLAKQYGQKVN